MASKHLESQMTAAHPSSVSTNSRDGQHQGGVDGIAPGVIDNQVGLLGCQKQQDGCDHTHYHCQLQGKEMNDI